MSPVQQTRITPRTVIVMAVSAVIIAVGLLVFLLVSLPRITDTGGVQVQLGSDTFEAGFASSQADVIAADGPILYSDVGGGQRDIYLQHLGDDPTSGWLAFDARRAGTGRECTVAWDHVEQQFDDPCDSPPVPADGDGLRQAQVELSGPAGSEQLTIDLR